MKIAAAAYPFEWFDRWNEYVGKLRVWVRSAAEEEADLIVFPEWAALELASLAGEEVARDLLQSIDAITARIDEVDGLHASLAREFGVHICAGSALLRLEDGRIVNRARLFAPDGNSGWQDKLIPTPYEREAAGVAGGDALRVFDTSLGCIGIAICYDCEFPLIPRAMAEAGADILLVPSCTETLRGHWRVSIGARARALENQFLTVQSHTVGDAGWSPAIETNVGTGAIYGPPDSGFPEDGVLAIGKRDEPGWTYAEVSLDAVRDVRSSGTVRNHTHWAEQDGRLARAERVPLGAPQEAAGEG
jgi:predicted amidohydrolase